MLNTLWLITLTILVLLQGYYMRKLEEEIEAIKSWYPLCELMKLRIPREEDMKS